MKSQISESPSLTTSGRTESSLLSPLPHNVRGLGVSVSDLWFYERGPTFMVEGVLCCRSGSTRRSPMAFEVEDTRNLRKVSLLLMISWIIKLQ